MTRLETNFDRFDAGIDMAVQLILAAYGAKGGNVLLCGGDERRVFDDGFKAMQILLPEGPCEKEAVAHLFGAAESARAMVGDGTSTTVLLAAALIKAGRKLRADGYSAREVVAAIRDAADKILAHMKERAVPPEEEDVIAAVTLAMHGNEEAGRQIGSFLHKAGENALMVPSALFGGKSIELERREGLVWGAGVMSKEMLMGAPRREFKDMYVIMSSVTCADMQSGEWKAIRHAINSVGATSVLLICPVAEGPVLATFTRAASEGTDWCIVGVPDKMNAWGFLSDLAEVIGGKVINDLKGNIGDQFDATWFGRVSKFTVMEHSSCIDMTETLADRIAALRATLEEQLESPDVKNSDVLKQGLRSRLQFLSGFYGSVSIPFISAGQFSAIREEVDDGVLAGRAALKGVLPGCSKALWAASVETLGDDADQKAPGARDKLRDALFAAFSNTWHVQVRVGGESSGLKPSASHKEMLDKYWLTVDTRDSAVVNARDAGILDSYAVLETAVKVAVGVSIPIIEANILIVVEPDAVVEGGDQQQ